MSNKAPQRDGKTGAADGGILELLKVQEENEHLCA